MQIPPVTTPYVPPETPTPTVFKKAARQTLGELLDSHFPRQDPLDTEFNEIVQTIRNSDLSVVAQVLMLDVLRTLATIRKQHTLTAHKQSINALDYAKSASKSQLAQARSQYISEIISVSATTIQAGVELGVAVGSSIRGNSGVRDIHNRANQMDFSDPAPAAPVRPAGAPPAYAETEDIKTPLDAKPTKVAPDDDPDAPGIRTPQNDTRRSEWIETATRNMYTKLDMQGRIATAIGTFITSTLKFGSASESDQAARKQAETMLYQALDRFVQMEEQNENNFAGDMKQSFIQALEFIRQTEAARHQSAGTIANI